MQAENNNPNDAPDEAAIAGWLVPLDRDTAPYDAAAAGRIDRLAAEAFAAESGIAPTTRSDSTPPDSSRRRRHMFTKAAAALAAVACMVVMMFQLADTSAGKETLGDVLARTLQADSLELKVTREGDTAEVLVEPSGRVRWQQTPTAYRIAEGTRLWQIDEQANTVLQQRSPWYDAEQKQVDLLALLGIEGEGAAEFRETTGEAVTLQDEEIRKYAFETTVGGKPLTLEATADGKTGLLRTIAAWPRGRRSGPPLAELSLIARNVAIDEEKFAVATSLSEDGRIGKIVDAQGIVGLRPALSDRWTPVCRQLLLKPGDWLRTDVRGANAAALTTTGNRRLTAGPGTLVELNGPNQVKLHGGELKISGDKGAKQPLQLSGPAGKPVAVAANETVHYRVDRDGNLQQVANPPLWLQGFEGTTVNDSIGSLIAKIDGRDVPLTVGYHKVSVEIRDQIARTTIEESFVNRTAGTLEGVFHFPLPHDASISGFGMWINGELIEADVVEKQRAREIYETILRERRDPGLLEWTGGNIFKARVFPITPHSEKRIKIVYTQVLPLRANQYRYSYGLRSEMLQTTPLRELSLKVLINSALPLKSVRSPTHSVRAQQTAHSAQLDFAAQEYTPERDFEVVCELEPGSADVIVVPHRRGDDGYFMVQLTPPSGEGNWQREIVSDGKPLELLLVCDTSASMDSEKRRLQEEFIASTLAALGPKDRFNLAFCDVNTRWWRDQPAAPSKETIADARQQLADRVSLGWTDLDRMVEAVLPKLNQQTHVVYVGDGIVTAHNADPQAFANRLRLLTAEQRTGTFHAVSIGNSFESAVLQAIARIGGGSVRQISGEQTPQQTALELLNEIAQPGLRDLKVEFRGLQVAAVYPGELPNLAAGTQQILLGRYLPQGEQQTGEIVITGTRDSEPVRFSSRIALADAESGNSFIPRLWARAHLDQLLAQGGSQAIRDEIIAMSEEFHIITPYTSLLVLETDADRERFKVKRRYEMRDGERFFADGRDNANYDLLQQQMKRAGDWRLALRRRILAHLSGLGRNPQVFRSQDEYHRYRGLAASGPVPPAEPDMYFGRRAGMAGSGEFESLGIVDRTEANLSLGLDFAKDALYDTDGEMFADDKLNEFAEAKSELWFGDRLVTLEERDMRLEPAGMPALRKELSQDREVFNEFPRRPSYWQLGGELAAKEAFGFRTHLGAKSGKPLDGLHGGAFGGGFGEYAARTASSDIGWFRQLLTELPAAPAAAPDQASDWPADAVEISKSLHQPLTLEGAGLQIALRTESTDPVWDRPTGDSSQHQLYSDSRWLHYPAVLGSPTVVHWCDAEQRGVYSRCLQLGTVRDATAGDLESFTPGNRPLADGRLHISYRGYDVEIERPAEGRAVLLLRAKQADPAVPRLPLPHVRITIDTQRNVVLENTWSDGHRVTLRTVYSEFFEAAGAWWPAKIETFDGKNRRVSEGSQTVTMLNAEEFARRFEADLPPGDTALLFELPWPTVREAEKAHAAGSAAAEHLVILMLRSALIQQWDEVLTQLEALEKLEPAKPGLRWVRALALIAARRNETARQLLLEQAEQVVAGEVNDELHLANFVFGQLQQIADSNEQLRALEQLRPVYERQAEHANASRIWKGYYAQLLRNLGRVEEVLAISRELAESAPWDVSAQTTYAHDLKRMGEIEAAYAWLRAQLARDVERDEYFVIQLRSTVANMLREEGRDDDLLAFLEEWIAADSNNAQPYEQYLSALVLADQVEKADATALRWIEEAQVEEQLSQPKLARLNVAINFAVGHRYQLYMNYMEPKWYEPLRQAAEFFLDHDYHFDIAARILGDHRFLDSDEADRLLAEIARRLHANAETIALNRLPSYVSWVVGRGLLPTEQWKQIAATTRERWQAAEEPPQRHAVGEALVHIYRVHFADAELLPFKRLRIERALNEEHAAYADSFRMELFNELLLRKWNAEHEAEALKLIEQLASASEVAQRLITRLDALHRWADRMLETRYQAAVEDLQDQGHPEELTRTELAAKLADFRTEAMKAVSELLKSQLAREPDAPAAPEEALVRQEYDAWMTLERIYLDLRLDRNQEQAAAELWKMLGDEPPRFDDDELGDEPAGEAQLLAEARRAIEAQRLARAFVTITYLAARRSAPEELITRLEGYIAAGLDRQGDAAAPWKQARYGLLAALDRPDDLERELREWIRTDPFPAPWQLALARLVAERGKIEEAITLMETVEKETQLSPADYQMLAGWYLVDDQRREYQRAKIEVFKVWPEYQLSNWIRQHRYRWQDSGQNLPSELDEDVLFAFRALFEKSSQPENYAYELREFYTACRDFRLLQMLPDAVVGRTPQQVYPLLERLRTAVIEEIRKESTADEILARLEAVRQRRESPLDLRALDLLEAMIERQSSEVLNQPGPHIEAAVAAMRRALDREWAEGEVRQMAKLLDSLGTISQQQLNEERLREFKLLHALTEPGTDDRLFVAWHYAHALYYSHQQQQPALAIMQIALREFDQTHAEGWPSHANEPLFGYAEMLESLSRFAAAEALLTGYLENPANDSQRYLLTQRRDETWHDALGGGGRVSLGSGAELYSRLHAAFVERLKGIEDDSHRQQTIDRLLNIYRTAHEKKYEAFRADLLMFAFDLLPTLLQRQTNNYSYIVERAADVVKELLGPREGLRFMIARYEDYPPRFNYTWNSAWRQLSYRMAQWYREAKAESKDLEPRLLKLVLAELRRDLLTRHDNSRYFYDRNYSSTYHWEEKTEEFVRVAEEVLAERKDSGRAATYVARYLFDGLHKYDRAIEVLLIAHGQGQLDENQQVVLIDYLHRCDRFAESIAILEPLVERRPDVIGYRTRLIKAYARASRAEQVRQLLAATDAHFRQAGRWTEATIAALASVCLEIDLHQESAAYFEEVIALHQRTAPNRGIGNGTLSNYYSQLAQAYSGLGETIKAVDAASAGVVAWGPRHDQRQDSILWLRRVLAHAKDLDAYVEHLDQQAAETGQDTPLVRQQIGLVYAERGEHVKAIAQLRIAVELQPHDLQSHQALIASYKAVGDQQAVVEQMLAQLDLDRHNLALYKELANELKDDEAQAERAATTIVEAAPNEAEHHQALAEFRQEQGRWAEAIEHWKQVAELRRLEPTGLLKLAEAQLHEERYEEVRETAAKLNQTEWPSRFGNIRYQIEELQRRLPKSN